MRLALAAALVATVAVSACEKSGSGTDTAAGARAPTQGVAPAAPAPTDAEAAALLASLPAPYNTADLANGKKQFARCRSCHTLGEGQANLTGPNLYGVFGREAGSKPDYKYSEAVANADFVWEAKHLNDWLADPRGYLPGTKMSFAGLKDEKDRVDLIAYLKTQTGYKPA
ncbi:MAG TPA: cytochrome c family protein [Caulobacteraceae bacterium]|nr:cytochrome c family protein [Caulobacteraceae bacterium]